MIKINIQKKFVTRSTKSIKLNYQCEIPIEQTSSLFGESGAGKTTLLKMLSGLLTPDVGNITVNGQIWFDSEKKINLPIVARSLGFLFQDSSLLANMNVRQNLEFAFRKGNEDKQFLNELITFAEIEDLLDKRIEGLSGGQKQRIALVRTLVQKPKFLFLDEPFSSLDQRIRNQLYSMILSLQNRFAMTILLISHEITEVIKLSKRVFLISEGQIVSSGHPIEIFNPKGKPNSLEGEVIRVDPSTNQVALWFPNALAIMESKNKNQNFKLGEMIHTQLSIENEEV
ncbi:ATP-binding cassette domain-containing protein [Leptospira perdikensis]|uniref:ATP-binding cassette domain-containing protein n=1 Tax=Leptospira perdikensis TaxID=2484948 RepID=A0A4R9JKJ6_9LEPT|nr:ATP-binding cassette domain-containing protein [Leptospira perdikensis]TGL44371.1 ATP-binding cassette domain-containing protein [Leptospira perdikensis]